MIAVELEKVIDEKEINDTQKGYIESLRKFEKLVEKGVLKKRENQLLVDNSNLKYNFQSFMLNKPKSTKRQLGAFNLSVLTEVQLTVRKKDIPKGMSF